MLAAKVHIVGAVGHIVVICSVHGIGLCLVGDDFLRRGLWGRLLRLYRALHDVVVKGLVGDGVCSYGEAMLYKVR